MSVSLTAMTAAELASYVLTTSEYATLEAALAQGGFYILETGEVVAKALAVTGGAGEFAVGTGTALELAETAQLAATGSKMATGSATLLKTATGCKAAGLLGMEMGAFAAAAAPVLGVALGAELYDSNPQLWTKISKFLLPYCYPGTTKIPTVMDMVEETGTYKVLAKLGIIEGLKALFDSEGIGPTGEVGYSVGPGYTWAEGIEQPLLTSQSFVLETDTVIDTYTAQDCTFVAYKYSDTSGIHIDAYGLGTSYEIHWHLHRVYKQGGTAYDFDRSSSDSNTTYISATRFRYSGITAIYNAAETVTLAINRAINDRKAIGTIIIDGQSIPVENYPAGTSKWQGNAPAAPPITWPFPWIIIPEEPIPTPLPDPEPLTPITPSPEPEVDPSPVPEPEPEPEPAPYEPPEEWPAEEPWPVVIPFPWEPEVQPTEPWPEYIPWPLPPGDPTTWPKTPEDWPFEIPEDWPIELPDHRSWPTTPEEWPQEIPWPDAPETKPDDWPEEMPWPWPASPEDWPLEVPWPVPWPEDWPDDEPWPVRWPEEIPYPRKFPYPNQSPDPQQDPTPGDITNPERQIRRFIEPWPLPDPSETDQPWTPTPNPWEPADPPPPSEDPTQPNPTQPSEPPVQPTEPPPSGLSPDPLPPIIALPFSSTTGLISVYNPTQSELLSFAQWLWVTWQDATIEKIWNNPFDGVITLFELYCTPTIVGRKNIRSGFLDSGVAADTVSRYTEIDCGSIGVPEYYGNYLDYSPYSKAFIYLPFIGVVEVSVDDIVGHCVNITYRIDEYNGSCIAMITVAKITTVNGEEVEYSNLLYQFSGNCAVELPLAGGTQAAIRAGMIQAASYGITGAIGGIASMLSGGIASGVSQIANGVGSAVGSVVSAKSSVQHSGSFGASYGAMGGKIPYITIIRPKQIQVPNYNLLYGYQAHKAVNVGSCTGYLRCREVHVHSSTASNEEKALIEQLLKEGVYVTE